MSTVICSGIGNGSDADIHLGYQDTTGSACAPPDRFDTSGEFKALQRMKVPELRAECAERGLDAGGLKAVLVSALLSARAVGVHVRPGDDLQDEEDELATSTDPPGITGRI